MELRAKEGSRTPTRVTPLEPEGTASSGKLPTIRDVSAVLWVHMRPQNAARNSRPPQDNGARTGIRTLVFWKAEPASWGAS
jgi:hypothetical protein